MKEGEIVRELIPLNFGWFFLREFTKDHLDDFYDTGGYQKVDLPHNIADIPLNYPDHGIKGFLSVYKKEFRLPDSIAGKKIRAVFEGIAHSCTIYCNGKLIMKHDGGYDEFAADISSACHPGTNMLAIVVDSRENPDIPPFGDRVDYLGYGGIYREVHMEITEMSASITYCHLKTYDLNKNLIIADIALTCPAGMLRIRVFDRGRQLFHNDFPVRSAQDVYVCELPEKRLWTPDDPYLYTVSAELLTDGVVRDNIEMRFGFRMIKFQENGFFLNGKPIKLRGLNRHQSYPYVGYAMPKSVQEKDADILKFGLGVNIVRTSHYLQSRHFLNRCDEIGLMVMEEIPGWQHIGGEAFKENTLHNVEAMIERDYNHPSVVLWGVRINESPDDDELYRETNRLAHRLDDTRPTGGVRNFSGSAMFEDVYTFNDFTHDSTKKVLRNPDSVKKHVPYMVTEYNGHMYPTKRYDDEPHRVEHALRHYRVLKEAASNPRISGTIGWCMNDYNTHPDFGSGDCVCYHGVLDMFRNEKYAAFIYASQQDQIPVMEVLSTLNGGDYPAGRMFPVYIASNMDFIKIYRDDSYLDTVYPEKECCLPHPIYIVNDLVGNQLQEKYGFSEKDSRTAKELFRAITEYGPLLPLRYKLKMLKLLKTYHLSVQDAVSIYYQYSGGAHNYRFEGYIGGKIAKTTMVGNLDHVIFSLNADREELVIGETYDAVRLVIRETDQDYHLLPYAFDSFEIKTEGGISVIGPARSALSGGAAAFWVRTNDRKGKALVRVSIGEVTLTKTLMIK